MHPFAEKAQILRDMARNEARDKWADQEKIRKLRAEAAELDRMARSDTQDEEHDS
jgi:hypothetical protein